MRRVFYIQKAGMIKRRQTWKVTQTSACPRPQIPGRPAFFCRGHAVNVEGQEGDWSKVSSDGIEGYIRTDLLVFGEEARVHYKNVCGFTGTVTASSLRVRTQPSLEAETIGSLGNSSQIRIEGTEGEWYQVEYKGTDAFVHSDYVDLEDSVQGAMTVEEYQELQKQEEAGAASTQSSTAVSAGSGDLAMLAALIECEAGGESYTGKVAGRSSCSEPREKRFLPEQHFRGHLSVRSVFHRYPVENSRMFFPEAREATATKRRRRRWQERIRWGTVCISTVVPERGIQIGNQHFY